MARARLEEPLPRNPLGLMCLLGAAALWTSWPTACYFSAKSKFTWSADLQATQSGMISDDRCCVRAELLACDDMTTPITCQTRFGSERRAADILQTRRGGLLFLHMRKAGGTYIGQTLRRFLRDQTPSCCLTGREFSCRPAPWFYQSHHGNRSWKCQEFHFKEVEHNFIEPALLDEPSVISVTHIRHPLERIVSSFMYESREFKEFAASYELSGTEQWLIRYAALRNETLWTSYLDRPRKPVKGFWGGQYVANYYAHALSVDSCTNGSLVYGGLPELFHTCPYPSTLKSMSDIISRLRKFSLVLVDQDQGWDDRLGALLGANMSVFSRTASDRKQDHGNRTWRSYLPQAIRARLEEESALDLQVYRHFIRGHCC